MKTGRLLFAMLLASGMIVSSLRAQTAVSVDFFYEPLEPYGSWYEMDDYGYVWQPHDIAAEWSPYSDGRWVYTDAGWTWYSNEPYGWAVYHYGRWANVHEVGWVWVPDTEWGPAWVSWRRSPEYVGWAPLPPEARFHVSIGFNSWVDRYYDIGPRHYRFVETSHLGAPRLNNVIIDRSRNITIVNQTTNITNITRRNNVVYNGGPEYDELSRASREPIPRYRLERRREAARDGRVAESELRARIEGDTLQVAELPAEAPRERRKPKVEKELKQAEVDRGWREAGSPEEVARARQRIEQEAELPADLPEKTPVRDREIGKGRPADRGEEQMKGEANRPERAGTEDPDKTPNNRDDRRMKGERPEAVPPAPGLPPSPPRGKGDPEQTGNLPPDPNVPRPSRERPDGENGNPAMPPSERPDQAPEERLESKGTKKDPTEPGTRVEPAQPAPPANERSRDRTPEAEPDTRTGRMTPPPAPPGGSATPPLPPEPRPAPQRANPENRNERNPAKERPAPKAKGPEPPRPAPAERAPGREREPEREREKEKGKGNPR